MVWNNLSEELKALHCLNDFNKAYRVCSYFFYGILHIAIYIVLCMTKIHLSMINPNSMWNAERVLEHTVFYSHIQRNFYYCLLSYEYVLWNLFLSCNSRCKYVSYVLRISFYIMILVLTIYVHVLYQTGPHGSTVPIERTACMNIFEIKKNKNENLMHNRSEYDMYTVWILTHDTNCVRHINTAIAVYDSCWTLHSLQNLHSLDAIVLKAWHYSEESSSDNVHIVNPKSTRVTCCVICSLVSTVRLEM